MKVKGRRQVMRTVRVEIEIIGKSDRSGPCSKLWEDLKRKCFICQRPMMIGDFYYIAMYREGKKLQRSGACHCECLDSQEICE